MVPTSMRAEQRGLLHGSRRVLSWMLWHGLWPVARPAITYLFHTALLMQTRDYQTVRWCGHYIRQSIFDLWTLQETIADLRPRLIIETGTHQGGSALFYAQLLDLLNIDGAVITIDIAAQIDAPPHRKVQAWPGDSTDPAIVDRVRAAVAEATGPVLVILDSDHSEAHVARELSAYAPFVTPGSYLLVQDGIIDVLGLYRAQRPGPLGAIHRFLAEHREFQLDRAKADRFLITHHPDGWLRRL